MLRGRGLDLNLGDDALYNAYAKSMKLAAEKGLGSVAFSLLSAGVFRGPRTLAKVLGLGVEAILDEAYSGLREVHMVAFNRKEFETLEGVATQLCGGNRGEGGGGGERAGGGAGGEGGEGRSTSAPAALGGGGG
jgi:hypothetical protein